MEDFISYKSSSPSGDLISFLAGIRQMYIETGKKGVVYQILNMVGVGHPDSIHPYSNTYGEPVCMNQYAFDMLYPLLKAQEYIEDYRVYSGEKVDFDFDLIRFERQTLQPKYSLNRWFFLVFPQMTTDLSKAWVTVNKADYSDKIIINFTQRYRHHVMNYFFLKNYQDRILFAGLESERNIFCEQWGLDIQLLKVNDFLELAAAIKGCKFFMGNQSFCFQLAESLKVPRVLEIFPMMPNVIPTGEQSYDYCSQSACEFYFDKLLNT